ncbi:SEL1-like repeat protein, partial [Burkholderia cenocepacia]
MYRRLLAPGLLLLLAACAQDPSVTAGTVRICDDTGCSDRPKDQVSYQKRDDAEDRDDPRIAALKQTAKTQPKAAYDLGLRYFRGDGVRQDSYQALKWMREAAERGD